MLLYVGLTAYGVVPALHWISLNGGLQSPVVQVETLIVIIIIFILLLFKYWLERFWGLKEQKLKAKEMLDLERLALFLEPPAAANIRISRRISVRRKKYGQPKSQPNMYSRISARKGIDC